MKWLAILRVGSKNKTKKNHQKKVTASFPGVIPPISERSLVAAGTLVVGYLGMEWPGCLGRWCREPQQVSQVLLHGT